MFYIIGELFNRRSLIWELALKNLKIRYSRPYLGFFWAFLSPFLTALVYYVIFSKIFKFRIEGLPFFLYLMSAIFPWSFFQNSLMCSVTSLIDNRNLIKEAKFPHYLITFSILLENMIVFLPSLIILILVSLFTLKALPISIVFLPAILFIHAIITVGLSFILSILYVKWRDIKYILEMALLIIFYFTPAFYSMDVIKNAFPHLFKIYIFNPFVGILNLYRIALLRGFYSNAKNEVGIFPLVAIIFVFTFAILISAFYLYKKNKNNINDYLSY